MPHKTARGPRKPKGIIDLDALPRETLIDRHAVAGALGVSHPTVRRWELTGLLPQPVRVTPSVVRHRAGVIADFRRSFAPAAATE